MQHVPVVCRGRFPTHWKEADTLTSDNRPWTPSNLKDPDISCGIICLFLSLYHLRFLCQFQWLVQTQLFYLSSMGMMLHCIVTCVWQKPTDLLELWHGKVPWPHYYRKKRSGTKTNINKKWWVHVPPPPPPRTHRANSVWDHIGSKRCVTNHTSVSTFLCSTHYTLCTYSQSAQTSTGSYWLKSNIAVEDLRAETLADAFWEYLQHIDLWTLILNLNLQGRWQFITQKH